MSSNILYSKNYTELGEAYQLVLPLSLEGLLPEDESVRLLSHELEELDYTLLYQAYSAKGRNPAVDPKTMFKILTYAYSQNIYLSRKIETACRRDINFMWLLAGQKAPDHSIIARFRTGFLADACEDLFYQMVRRLASMDELAKETVFIDGTKLEACANKYTFVWKKSVGKWEEKMFVKMEDAVQMLNREYRQSFCISKENRASDLQGIVDYLKDFCLTNTIVFVHGRGKRKSIHQRYLELFERFLNRQLLYDLHHSRFGSRNSYSKTDVDATFMHMKDDHMRNAQLKPGYNVQIGVDSEYIVAVDISKRENMGYDEESDTYTCHAGKTLSPLYVKKQRSKNGYESEVTVYECAGCSGCPYKNKCTKAKGNKRLYVSKNFINHRQVSYENIMSETGMKYRMNRSVQVEGAFGVLKNDYNFQRFLLRGKTKVKLEILLLCFGYNINKLHAKIQNDRLGSHLFPLKTA